MRRINCPLCGWNCFVIEDIDPFRVIGPVLLMHTPRPGPGLDEVRHPGSPSCLGSGLEPEFARAVARERAAGRHLLAHP